MEFDNFISLNDIVYKSNTGADAIKKAPIVEENTGIKCLRIQDVSNHKDFNDWGNCKIDKKYYSNFQLKKDDIIISRTGNTIGTNIIILEDLESVYNNGLIRIKIKNNFDSKFVYYNLQSKKFRDFINSIAYGTSAQPNMKINDFLSFKIKYFELPEQKKIASILSAFDEKIQLNNQINKNLEQMAQVLFKSWFVDFEPFLDEEFEETELGLIPKNWTVDTLNKIAKVNSKSINPESETFYNHYSLPAFDDYKYPEIVDGETIKSNKTLMTNNTILLSKLNPRFKRLWLNLDIDNEYKNISSTEFINYEPLEEKYYSYLYFLLDSQYFQDLLNSNATGSTGSRQRVKPNETLNYKIIIPNDIVLLEFHNKIISFIEKIKLNIKENKILENKRDILLPKLISGEIRV